MLLLASMLTVSSAAFAVDPLQGIPAEVAKRHQLFIDEKSCEPDSVFESTSQDLGKGIKLVIVNCIMGAYQGSDKVYLFNPNEGNTVTDVIVLRSNGKGAVIGTSDIGSAGYEEKTHILYSQSKGRGIGDCGMSSRSKLTMTDYGSVEVKTVEIRHKINCDEKMNPWPVVFKQK